MTQTASDYRRARRARTTARALARAPLASLPDAPALCPSCHRPLTRVVDTWYCLAPITGPRSCQRAYTD